jgi:hypothetical protein
MRFVEPVMPSTNGVTIHNVTIKDDTVPPGAEALSEALRISAEILRAQLPNGRKAKLENQGARIIAPPLRMLVSPKP